MAGYRIPDELVQAFHEAIQQLDGWNWVGREPVVSLDEEDCRSYRSIGSIADYASIFDDPMPDNIYNDLCRVARAGQKPIGVTFEAGAKLLRHVYDEVVDQRAVCSRAGQPQL
jgi:hypothetical protein